MYKIPTNTLLLGKNIVYVPECRSTNDYALRLTQNSLTIPEGILVITDNQIAGRGQRGSTWESSPGMNLTFSLVFKPTTLAIRDQFYLNIFTALGIRDYIKEKTDAIVHIKWPNDIMVKGNKCCGILIENQLQGNHFTHVVAGVGLNINQTDFKGYNATSMQLVAGVKYNLTEELEPLLKQIESRYLQLHQQKYQLLKSDYFDAMYWLNEKHLFKSKDMNFEGTIVGIDEVGLLRIKTQDGVKVFGMKEVLYVG